MKKKTKSSISRGFRLRIRHAAAATVISLVMLLGAYSGEIGTPPPPDGGLDAGQSGAVIKNAVKTAGRFCVGVSIKFTPPPSDDMKLRKLHSDYSRMLERHRSKENPMLMSGVVIAPDRVLIDAPYLRLEDIESIKIITAEGKTFSAIPGGFLQNFDGFILEVNSSSEALDVPEFTGSRPEKPGDAYITASMYFSDGCWMLGVNPRTVTGSNVSGETMILASDSAGLASLLLDGEGNPFGVQTHRHLWRDENKRSSFDGDEIRKDDRHSISDVLSLWEDIEKVIAPSTLPLVTFVFRPLEEGDRPTWYARRTATLEEEKVYGVFIDDAGSVFIPSTFPVEKVKRIDRITVECGGETQRQATFQGCFRDFDGMLVKVQDYTAQTSPSMKRDGKAVRGELLFSARVSYSFGGRFMQFIPNRITSYSFGVGETLVPHTRFSMSSRDFLMDSSGNVIGFMSSEYPEAADGTKSAAAATRRIGYSRLFFFADISEVLDSPAPHFDPKAKVLTREEEKKLAWLGIEYQPMNYDLAKYLKILSETKNGRIGFMVIHMYPGSPAERLHVRNGDVLLSLRPLDEKTSIELTDSGSGYYGRRRYYGGYGKPSPPWRDRKNTLSDTLTWIGKDRRAELTFLRKSGKDSYESKAITMTVEESPPDFSSAEEYKDETLGFTAKELTYEVRFYQKLPEDERGIVISEVESGLAAEIAKLRPFEIVREVDGVPVRGLDHFKGLITQALKDEDRKTIRFLVVRFGQTRFVDLEKK